MDLMELLVAGEVERFNTARSRADAPQLFAADLPGAQLSGVDLSGADLEKSDLSEADLTDSMLVRARLSGADLTEARISSAMAIRSQWKEAYLGDADLTEGDFSQADFTEAELPGARLSRATLRSARFRRADLTKAKLDGADLSEGRLDSANLTGADLTGTILREAKLSGADLSGANLREADLTRAKMAEVNLTGADLSGAKLIGADLSGATLTGATIDGAVFTRADLSEVDLSGLDLVKADLTEAMVEAPFAHATVVEVPPPVAVVVDEPVLAAGPGGVVVLWDNPEPSGKPSIRVAVGRTRKSKPSKVRGIGIPTDLVVARAVTTDGEGFMALFLVERPGGTVASFVPISREGVPGAPRSYRMPYTPAARPVLEESPDGIVLYGVSREGPGLQVHRLTPDKLERVFAKSMPTVRGFASDRVPLVLSKGGVLVKMGRRGLQEPIGAPKSFPGRRCAAAALETSLYLVWASRETRGFHTAQLPDRGATEERHHLPKVDIGTVDMTEYKGDAWLAYTREPASPEDTAEAWAMRLPDGEPFPVVSGPDDDVSDIRLITTPVGPALAVTGLDGRLGMVGLKKTGPRLWWTLE